MQWFKMDKMRFHAQRVKQLVLAQNLRSLGLLHQKNALSYSFSPAALWHVATKIQVLLLRIIFSFIHAEAHNELLRGVYFQVLGCRNRDGLVVSWVTALHPQLGFDPLLQESHLRFFAMN
ncbi:Os09g0397950 [Oryza sativa Japonica Group]|uniref:Os09g0397950 protein n=1 Tax=Oryza sativa subsp. japonica TaxID=39947 RepID=A0A0P0XLZ0_ORYSJ|nr:hypothetical protein EE612_047617 [Oryza sativa]BAT07945.1 Os09g0397950 [Oryza sativa Japonica Group]